VPRNPKLHAQIKGCPILAGDYVRKNEAGKFMDTPATMIVQGVCLIPNIGEKNEGYGSDVKELPYWAYCTDLHGIAFKSRSGGTYSGAIWVGFLTADHFLGAAKRAVMESDA